jgi:mRNA-degrading endonuclease RelE of RelBE toxin-antitoxin system
MTFTVEWDAAAEDDLMDLWLAAPDRSAITTASASIDRLLSTNPHGFGQYLSEGLWRLRVSPLVIHYTIDANRQHVEVTAVARTS